MTLNLTSDIAAGLTTIAAVRGLSVEQCLRQILEHELARAQANELPRNEGSGMVLENGLLIYGAGTARDGRGGDPCHDWGEVLRLPAVRKRLAVKLPNFSGFSSTPSTASLCSSAAERICASPGTEDPRSVERNLANVAFPMFHGNLARRHGAARQYHAGVCEAAQQHFRRVVHR